MKSRSTLWVEYDAEIARFANWRLAPAFISEEKVGGLWSVQVLRRPPVPVFGRIHRRFCAPPRASQYEPYYDAWPGDHRGWMRFRTKEDARDFYKFATRKMSFEEYCALPRGEWSGKTIYLDDAGEFTDAEQASL